MCVHVVCVRFIVDRLGASPATFSWAQGVVVGLQGGWAWQAARHCGHPDLVQAWPRYCSVPSFRSAHTQAWPQVLMSLGHLASMGLLSPEWNPQSLFFGITPCLLLPLAGPSYMSDQSGTEKANFLYRPADCGDFPENRFSHWEVWPSCRQAGDSGEGLNCGF